MSVSSTLRKQQFTLDGIEDNYTFTFRALTSAPEDIKCSVTTAGVTTILTYTTQYSVTINSDGVGGTVTLVSASTIGLGTLTVYRETTNTQESDYDDYNQFPANTLEEDIDKRTMVEQEQAETFDRTIKFPIESTTKDIDFPEPAASKLIGWNSVADGLENKIPSTITLGEFAVIGDYSDNLSTALDTIGATQKLLIINKAITLSASVIIPATLSLWIVKGGSIVKASTYTLTINGPFEAGIYQVFSGFSSGNVTFGVGSVAEVRPEWWVENTTPGTTDMTTAIGYALATGKNVRLNGCLYGTTGLHRIATAGQQVLGAGDDIVGAVKTVIKKLSGTDYILDTTYTISGIAIKDICFDRNDLDGSGIIWRGHYSEIKNISFKTANSTGTGVDLHISGVNLSKFEKINVNSLLIDQSSDTYAPKPTYGCLYSSFKNISVLGTFEMTGVINMGLTFDDMYVENDGLNPSIYIHGSNNACLYFNNLKSESILRTTPLISVAAGIYNIHFRGGRLMENVAQTESVFYFNGMQDMSVSDMEFNDPYSVAGKEIITLTNVYQAFFENNEASATNDYVFIHNTAASEYITSRGNRARSYGSQLGVGTNVFNLVDHLTIDRDAFEPTITNSTYVNISDTLNIHSQRTVGLITVADDEYYDIFGDGGITNPKQNFMGLITISAVTTSTTSINNIAFFYAQSGSVSATQSHSSIAIGSNVEIVDIADDTAAALASTTDGKLGVQIGGGSVTKRFVRVYNRTGGTVNLRVHVDRFEE